MAALHCGCGPDSITLTSAPDLGRRRPHVNVQRVFILTGAPGSEKSAILEAPSKPTGDWQTITQD